MEGRGSSRYDITTVKLQKARNGLRALQKLSIPDSGVS